MEIKTEDVIDNEALQFQIMLAAIEPIDPVIIPMLPEGSQAFYERAPEIVKELLDGMHKAAIRLVEMEKQHALLKEAIQSYAVQSGEGQLFLQNLDLCINQIKAGIKEKGRL